MARPLPKPPFHAIDGLVNFRDLGGYPIAGSGKFIRPGLIFRSAEPSQLTLEGISRLQALGIRRVYDLRSRVEIDRATLVTGPGKVTEWEGARRVFVPVFLDQDLSPGVIALWSRRFSSGGPESFVEAYKAIITAGSAKDHPNQPFHTIFTQLASDPQTPVLIHCSAGKDRTGIICAVILSLCGVDDEVVAGEYALTNLGLQDRVREHPALKGDCAALKKTLSSRKETMLATLDMIRKEHGSVEEFVISGCGVPADAVLRIRENLVVDISSAEHVLDVDIVFKDL